jgi:hypothetical protein
MIRFPEGELPAIVLAGIIVTLIIAGAYIVAVALAGGPIH